MGKEKTFDKKYVSFYLREGPLKERLKDDYFKSFDSFSNLLWGLIKDGYLYRDIQSDDPKKIKWAKVNLLKEILKDLQKSIEEDEEKNLKIIKGDDKSEKQESLFGKKEFIID